MNKWLRMCWNRRTVRPTLHPDGVKILQVAPFVQQKPGRTESGLGIDFIFALKRVC